MNTIDTAAEEQWKPIAGYEGLYDVSNHGRVRSYYTRGGQFNSEISNLPARILRPAAQHTGHLRITLCKCGIHESHYVSRLVAAAFLPTPPVYFVDGDYTNVTVDNIRYCSRAESKKHTDTGNSCNVKLSPEQVQQIREKYTAGEPCYGRSRRRTVTYTDLAREYGVGVPTISHVIKGITHKPSVA